MQNAVREWPMAARRRLVAAIRERDLTRPARRAAGSPCRLRAVSSLAVGLVCGAQICCSVAPPRSMPSGSPWQAAVADVVDARPMPVVGLTSRLRFPVSDGKYAVAS